MALQRTTILLLGLVVEHARFWNNKLAGRRRHICQVLSNLQGVHEDRRMVFFIVLYP